MRIFLILSFCCCLIAANVKANEAPEGGGIPIGFTLKDPGFVTLVVEDSQGVRVRNLISETEFPAGKQQVFWDGLDDLGRDLGAARFGAYHVPGKAVPAGEYTIRGLVRPKICLTYELAPYTNGKPAWFTADKSSGWLTNHSAPQGLLFLPSGVAPERGGKPASKNGQILVGSPFSEGGSGVAWLDMDGNKLHGQEWVGDIWTAATHFARDLGNNPLPGVYAYAGTGFGPGKSQPELRLNELLVPSEWGTKPNMTRLGTGEDRPVVSPAYKIANYPAKDAAAGDSHQQDILTGLAVNNGLLIAALEAVNELVFVDAREHKVLGNAKLDHPRGLLFDRRGRLWAVSGKQVLRFALGADFTVLPAPEVIVDKGLEDPQQMAFDQQGNIYVSDWGTSHQVKVFSSEGKLLRTIGQAGVPSVGPYDPLHMNHPAGLAIDDRGRLWVAEKDHSPKRVSVWSKDGALENAFYGPARYGGGGALDPRDKTVFYYGDETGGMQFRLDWATGKSRVEAVYYRKELDPVPLAGNFSGDAPETALPVDGRTYLTNAYNSNPTQGTSMAEIWLLEKGVARKVAAMGNAWEGKAWRPAFRSAEFASAMPPDFNPAKDALFFAWSDRNGDGQMQRDEVVFKRPDRPTFGDSCRLGGVTVEKDLSFVVAVFGDEAMRFQAGEFTKGGVPTYDLSRGAVLAHGVSVAPSSGGDQALTGKGGWAVFTTAPQPFSNYGFAGVRDGKPLWTYPNIWPGLHPSHDAPVPSFPGEVLGATRLVGPPISPRKSDAGELWAVNSNKGVINLFTMDGLFVTTLFRDCRSASWAVPEAVPGMAVDALSLSEECFWPQITQMDDGEIYLQVGTNDGPLRIVHVTGLDGIRRLPDLKIAVSEESLRAASESVRLAEAKRQEKRLPKKIRVPLLANKPTVDGKATEWKLANWAPIDSRRLHLGDWGGRQIVTRAALAVSGERLYGFFETDDSSLLKNAGTSLQTVFKTGGGLDVMVGAAGADPQRMAPVAGDVRLLISMVNGKPVAMIYRPVAPGSGAKPVDFTSLVKTVKIDQVEDVSSDLDLGSSLEKDKEGNVLLATYEFSIPLARLGLNPADGLSIRGDVGILRGDGLRTMQRVYWNNKSSGLVSDTPSEAELIPGLWGTFQFQAAP